MSRLPSRFQPLWPALKRGHRALTFVAGLLFRLLAPVLGPRAVPRRATRGSQETARRDPGAVTLHPGGGEEEILRPCPEGDPPQHPTFVAAERAVVPARYALVLEQGRVSGDFGATITASGVLDYGTSGYFGIGSWREHPLYLRPSLGRVEHLPGTVLSLATRGASSNYYHFLYDAVARFGIAEEALPGMMYDAVVVPHRASYQRQLLELARIPGRWVEPQPRHTFVGDQLVVPSTPNQDLDAPPWAVRWLRERLPARPDADGPRRVYLTRGSAPNTRRYVQEPELMPYLVDRGFEVVDPGTRSVQEQIDLFHGAQVVVAPHGAGLTNVTFCSPGARVLEMFAPSYVHTGLWAIAAALGDIDYRYLVGEGAGRDRPRLGNPYADVSIPVARVTAAIDELLD